MLRGFIDFQEDARVARKGQTRPKNGPLEPTKKHASAVFPVDAMGERLRTISFRLHAEQPAGPNELRADWPGLGVRGMRANDGAERIWIGRGSGRHGR